MNNIRTAIVTDDDHDTRDIISELLELREIQVVGTGKDGQEAVELYLKLRPHLVFLDVTMPNYDGLYALENIREINPYAKIIMITGDVTDKTRKRMDALNVPVFYKPVDMDKIMKFVNQTPSAPLTGLH